MTQAHQQGEQAKEELPTIPMIDIIATTNRKLDRLAVKLLARMDALESAVSEIRAGTAFIRQVNKNISSREKSLT